ncbi:MAG: GIY-YIG nuclease family protein [bacterium]
MVHVYILRSLRTGKLYVGHTKDLSRRLAEHNTGQGGRYSRHNGPWELVHSEVHPNRSEAMRREKYLKSVAGSREKRRLAAVEELEQP